MADDDLTARLRWPADERGAPRRGPLRPASPPPALRSVPPSPASEDVFGGDGELARLGHEVAELRRAIEELSERLGLRQLRAWLEEVRREVLALRGAVAERPELEQLAEDVAALRSELVTVRHPAAVASTEPALLPAIDELRSALSQLTSSSEPIVGLTPVLDELQELRAEVVALRRRVALRTQADEPVSDERLAELLEAVLEQRAGGRGRTRRRR